MYILFQARLFVLWLEIRVHEIAYEMRIPRAYPSLALAKTYKAELLDAALTHVESHGWTRQALLLACKDIGYPPVTHAMASPEELVQHFLQRGNEQLQTQLDNSTFEGGVTAKIRHGCVTRLAHTMTISKERYREALGIMTRPSNMSDSLRRLYEIVDEIWYFAGDRSLDLNWYSKRMLLAGVYSSTEVAWTADATRSNEETFDFLDRRLAHVGQLGKSINEVSAFVGFAGSGARGILQSGGISFPKWNPPSSNSDNQKA